MLQVMPNFWRVVYIIQYNVNVYEGVDAKIHTTCYITVAS